jgi:hypothetical protein
MSVGGVVLRSSARELNNGRHELESPVGNTYAPTCGKTYE